VRGFSHKVLLGILPRLAGADATIFPNFGGRFGFSEQECLGITAGSRAGMGRGSHSFTIQLNVSAFCG
jgi:ribulose-bisphosphate carboxylase large chain